MKIQPRQVLLALGLLILACLIAVYLVSLAREPVPENLAASVARLNDHRSDNATRFHAARALGGSRSAAVVPELVRSLKDPDWRIRQEAVVALGELGPMAARAVPNVFKLMTDDPNESVRLLAGGALTGIGGPAIPALLDGATDPREAVHRASILALINMKTVAKPAVPRLIEMLTSQNQETRSTAALLLSNLGANAAEAVPELARLLAQGGDETLELASALADIGPPAAEALTAALASDHVEVRRRVAHQLGDPRRELKASWSAEVAALADPDDDVRTGAVWAVCRQAADPATAIERLKPMLADSDDTVRLVAASALAELEAPDVAPLVLDLLVNRPGDHQRELVEALGQFGPQASVAVPKLAEMLRESHPLPEDEHLWLEGSLIRALGRIGPAANPALAAVWKRYDKAESWDRQQIAEAIIAIAPGAPAEAMPFALALANDEDPSRRTLAAQGLAASAAAPPAAKQALFKLFKDQEFPVRESAAEALGKLDRSAAPEVVPILLDELKRDDFGVPRAAIVTALLHFGDAAAAPALMAGLESFMWDDEERVLAAQSLAQLMPKSPDAAAALSRVARDPTGRHDVRLAAVQALADFVPLSPDAIAALREAAQEGEPLHSIALKTLEKAGVDPQQP